MGLWEYLPAPCGQGNPSTRVACLKVCVCTCPIESKTDTKAGHMNNTYVHHPDEQSHFGMAQAVVEATASKASRRAWFSNRKKASAPPAEDAVAPPMTAGRKAAVAAKEAAITAKQAAIAAQKAAREEHERAILPNKPTKLPLKREAPLRRPKVIVRVRPLAKTGGHSGTERRRRGPSQ